MTPLMQQYWQIKQSYPDKILLFRMGDFYEMFFDDAKIAAPILNIALTSRNKKAEDETPMCGVPHHSISGPIGKLLAAGLKVAICDQLEDPETAKGIVRRGVTRVLSPGMVYDPQTLQELNANYVASFDAGSVSFLDATTGESFYFHLSGPQKRQQVLELFSLLRPSEILISAERDEAADGADFANELKLIGTWTLTPLPAAYDEASFQDASHLDGFSLKIEEIPLSAKRLLAYAIEMQGPRVLTTLRPFERREFNERMMMSPNVLRHLEVFSSFRVTGTMGPEAAQDQGTLFRAINRTCTSAGARCLKRWLQFPLVNKQKIEERQDRIGEWTQKPRELKILRETLRKMGDIERRIAKISYNNCHPRDLLSLAESLETGLAVTPFCPQLDAGDVREIEQTRNLIRHHLIDEPPTHLKAGGFIKRGVNAELDGLIELDENSQGLLFELESRERQVSGISSLKIRYNNVFGYYIEVTNTHLDKIPEHYKRKQTLANAERFVTQELHELEGRILSAREKRARLEDEIFQQLKSAVLRNGQQLLAAAQVWSELDVVSSLAWLAIEQKYCRPVLKDGGGSLAAIVLRGSRHPVVEQEVERAFVPNDLTLSLGDCLLLTGPNMAGKSTLMRQIAVTVLLAQVGSFVPAQHAELPIFRQIFTRIGASDSLSEGLSTFMVEMKEAAQMLTCSGPDTLVILDEVGRGTSTYDGMSLAQSILEYLVQSVRATTLFATHYHELTALDSVYSQVRNMHMTIHEQGRDIHFMYTLRSGPASKSYGLHVARLAGVPEVVIERAEKLLAAHESRRESVDRDADLPLLKWQHERI